MVGSCSLHRFRGYLKYNWNKIRFVIKLVIYTFVLLFISFIVSPILGLFNLLNKEILKLLVQVEAIIMGFFGLIFIYILNSFDSRQDRYEDQLFELEISQDTKKYNKCN